MTTRLSRPLFPLITGAFSIACAVEIPSPDTTPTDQVGSGGTGSDTATGGAFSNSGGSSTSDPSGSGAAPAGGSFAAGGSLGSGGSTGVGGSLGTGGSTGVGGAISSGGSPGAGGQGSNDPVTVRVMSLNVYGHMTMPGAAPDYAALAESHNIDVLGIQEGNHDWKITTSMPTDYSRAEALGNALGDCWDRRYQIFVNTCRGATFVSHERFDLTDGPNATRTGEDAVVSKDGKQFAFIDIHWDHEDAGAKAANAQETAAAANAHGALPVIVLGDFNAGCQNQEPGAMVSAADLSLIVNGGIDCIFTRGASGGGMTVNAAPSDHPGVVAELSF